MRTNAKKTLLMLSAFCATAALSVATVSLTNQTSSADTITPSASEFYMEEGAAVRTTEGELGIRFSATITKSYWQELQTAYGADATYSFYSVVTDGTTPITKYYEITSVDFADKDTYTFYSTIIYTTEELETAGLLSAACELSLSAQTYVDITKAGETAAKTLAAYGATGARNMKAVANAEVLDGSEDEELAKYFTEGNRSESVEGYVFQDDSGVITMKNLPDLTEATDMEVYYGAEKIEATYTSGTVSFGGVELAENQTEDYISVFAGGKVYSSKVTKALKITQKNATDLLSLSGKTTVYLAEDIDLADIDWTGTTVAFSGAFEGNNHAIKNLTTGDNNGLFKTVQGTIRNVAFVDATTGANAAVIADAPAGGLTLENVFIDVSGGTNYVGATVRYGKEEYVTRMTNVVVHLPSASQRFNLFGYGVKGDIYLNNVHVINDNDQYLARANDTTNKYHETTHAYIKEAGYAIHADTTAFVKAEKTLPTFLSNCVDSYLNIVEIRQNNADDLLSLTGNEYVILMEDINIPKCLTDNELTNWTSTVVFTGTFDGDNHVIDGLTTTINNNYTYYGFFYKLGGTIKNVAFTNVQLRANSAVIAGESINAPNVANVFIDVTNTIHSNKRYGAIFYRSESNTTAITLRNVVIRMPGKNAQESILGWRLKACAASLTNVYTIGIKTTSPYPYTDTAGSFSATANDCGFYTDLTKFNDASKTLTDFLKVCVKQYLNTTATTEE